LVFLRVLPCSIDLRSHNVRFGFINRQSVHRWFDINRIGYLHAGCVHCELQSHRPLQHFVFPEHLYSDPLSLVVFHSWNFRKLLLELWSLQYPNSHILITRFLLHFPLGVGYYVTVWLFLSCLQGFHVFPVVSAWI